MKRKWVIVTTVCIIGLGVFIITSFIPRTIVRTEESAEYQIAPFSLEFTFIGESEYDPSVYYNYWLNDSPITNYNCGGKRDLDTLSERYKFIVPDNLDYENYLYIITYGRKIVDLRAESMNGTNPVPSITLEEEHQGNQVFIYQIKDLSIYPFRWPCYIMQGTERTYLGDDFSKMNELDPERDI